MSARHRNALILVTIEGVLFIPFICPISLLQHKAPETHYGQFFLKRSTQKAIYVEIATRTWTSEGRNWAEKDNDF